jgi:hypothetical protein
MIGTQDPEMQFPQGTRFAPYIVLRNTSKQNLSVTVKAAYSKGSAPTELLLQNVSLPAKGVQQSDMTTLLTQVGLSNLNGYLNLEASFKGGVGDLLVATGSVDQTGTYVFAVEPVVEQKTKSKIVCYWNTLADTDTMLALWSFSKQDQELTLRLFYADSHYDLPVHLPANASTMMSFESIIREQKPDASGQIIPSNVTEGSAVLMGARNSLDDIYVASAESEFNVRTATCSGNCQSCVGVEEFFFSPDPVMFARSQTQMMDVTLIMTSGGGGPVGPLSTWSSNNTAIATVSNTSPNVGMATGVAMGSTNLNFFYEDAPGGPPFCIQYCQIVDITGEPPVTVQIPTRLVRADSPCAPMGTGALRIINNQNIIDCAGDVLATNQCGVYRNYTYILVDQNGNEILTPYTVTEIISNFTSTIPGAHPTPVTIVNTDPSTTDASDIQSVSYTTSPAHPMCLASNDHSAFTQTFSVLSNGSNYGLTTTISVMKGRYNGTYTVNGTITIP